MQQEGSRCKSLSEPVKGERNRTAAAKCRARSKAAEKDLQKTQRIEQERTTYIQVIAEDLRNESFLLRKELLSHSNCNHPIINKYLSQIAEQIGREYDVPMRGVMILSRKSRSG